MIALRNVRFAYGRRGASFTCGALDLCSSLTLVVGPNGSGKSTLLKLAGGVEHPASGTITVHGHDLWREEVRARSDLAYVPEHPDLTPYASVGEVIELVCRLRHVPLGEGAECLARVGLAADLARRSVRELSLGQRRRAMVAAALVGAPATLLLDEPLEAMDRAMRELIIDWVRRVCESGGMSVIATHEIEPFVPLARRAVVADSGMVALIDPLPVDLTERLQLLERCARGGAHSAGADALPMFPATASRTRQAIP